MIIFAAIREVDGEELVFPLSARPLESRVEDDCNWIKRMTPEWDKENPVVRIAKFECTEVTE